MYGICVNIVMIFIIIQLQQTPLHYAARDGHTDSVALLVANGADVNMKTKVS